MIDWIPVVFVIFKLAMFSTCMFFAIKWHYDQGKKGKGKDLRTVLRAGGMVATLFVLSLMGLGLVTFGLVRTLDLDLQFP